MVLWISIAFGDGLKGKIKADGSSTSFVTLLCQYISSLVCHTSVTFLLSITQTDCIFDEDIQESFLGHKNVKQEPNNEQFHFNLWSQIELESR